MAEITLADLLTWEPRLRGGAGLPASPSALERELSWAVTARASPPMLPPLRGGELVLLPQRVIAEAGVSLPLLLRELSSHDVAAAVLEESPPADAPLPLLVAIPIGPDLEGEINRLLTEKRGDLYRAGTDLGRLLTGLTTTGAEPREILAAAAAALQVPAAVLDGRGTPLAASGADAVPPPAPAGARGWLDDRLAIPLAGGETLWLGPVPRPRRPLTRLAGERIAVATEAALLRAAQARPRGAARVAALQALLMGSGHEAGERAAIVGLPADATYRVALAAAATSAAALQRALAPLGALHEAGVVDNAAAAVVEARPEAPAAASGRLRPPGPGSPAGDAPADAAPAWLALSSPVRGPAALPAAAREARFVAGLVAADLVPGPVARFDALADLGPFQLLYHLWGSPSLASFAASALGDLPANDRRGTLRRTLLTYFDAGGSQVDAAARLGIHRNTLTYRLKQITTLTGQDPTDPSTRLVLHLALLAGSLPPAPEMGR